MSKKQTLMACFERGQRAVRERNFAYAHEMFAVCVAESPGHLAFVEAMLVNLKAKFAGDRKQAAHLLRLKGAKEFKQAVADHDWPQVVHRGVALLSQDPWDVPTLRGLALACEGLHHNEVELVYLKQALDSAPKDVDVNRHCALSLARMGQFDQAIACWHRIEEIRGKDAEAAAMVLRLTQEKMQYPEGRPPAAPKPPDEETELAAADQPVAPAAPAESVDVPETPRQRLERLIQEDPADVTHYLALAELLTHMQHFEEAERALLKAKHNCAQVHRIQQALDVVGAARSSYLEQQAQAQQAKQLAAERPPPRFPWLELLLAAAGVALVLQLVPSWWLALRANLQVVLIVINVLVLVALIAWQVRMRNSTK